MLVRWCEANVIYALLCFFATLRSTPEAIVRSMSLYKLPLYVYSSMNIKCLRNCSDNVNQRPNRNKRNRCDSWILPHTRDSHSVFVFIFVLGLADVLAILILMLSNQTLSLECTAKVIDVILMLTLEK